ncbi:hypothetical protein [Acinetobacter sp. ASP199]|uniref:hypothetical protein n=1 Tax=unclassified Acinetobacter TaxID=196816 RepID=UPI001F6094F3|nr:hypothetical protein [Acinetobacter sp. ASP199]UNT60189.1 hypothetical protein IHE35_05095 [Acinetobacter sp. ASP199]
MHSALYHRIDNDIEVKDGRIVPIKQMESWRIKLNSYAGLVFYIGLTLFGASPFILIGIAKLFRQKLELSMSFYMDATFMFIAFFILGVFCLYQSLKPEFAALFCQLEANENEKIEIVENNQAA